MRILWNEFKKVAFAPTLLGFVVLCLLISIGVALVEYGIHLLFSAVLPLVFAESCLIALFAALLSMGYENAHGTETLVYSTATGRNIIWCKLAVTVTVGFVFFCLLMYVTLAVFFAKYDYSAVWSDNVSLRATLVVAVLLAELFALLGCTVGILFRRMRTACTAAAFSCCGMYAWGALPRIGSVMRSIGLLTPFWLWRRSEQWFTQSYEDMLWANFETLGLLWSFAVLTAMIALAACLFRRRSLT